MHSPFRVEIIANDASLISVNELDTLFYQQMTSDGDQQAISMGFYVAADSTYGIPARGTQFTLNNTETQGPYRLWNEDTDAYH